MSPKRFYTGPVDVERILADPNFRVPDLTETVEGWRAWRIAEKLPPYGLPVNLYSVTPRSNDYRWAPRKRMQAECPSCGDSVPESSHTCGFYSARTLEHLQSMGYHDYGPERDGWVRIVGQVANWGKVIVCEQGWRAQYCYPVKLFVPFSQGRLVKPLREAYGVPVQFMNTLRLQDEEQDAS